MSNDNIVCVVDDDSSGRSAISRFLRSLSFNTMTFESGPDFLAWIATHEAACVISDVQMPGMSGVDMYLSMLASGKNVPTIFITAYPTDELKKRALSAGALAFLLKPVDVQQLTRLVAGAASSDKATD